MAYVFNPFTGSFDSTPTAAAPLISGAYLPLSGGTVTGNLQVSGTTTLSGALEIGTGNVATLIVSNNKLGINTETPNEELTVVGDVSSTNIVYANGGNSVLWNEVYTSYSASSSTFLTSETDSQTLSFNEGTKDLSISNGNTVSLSALVDAGGSISGDYLPLSGGTMYGPISFLYPYGARLDQGIYDSSRGGLSGISLVCSVNYDLNWQAGWITALEQDRITPRPLYIDSGVGTPLRVWNSSTSTGIEISDAQIAFADNTTQTTAFTGNTLSFNESTKDLSISNGNTVSLSALVNTSAIDTGVRALTSSWQTTYETVSSLSASWSAADEVLLAQVTNADSVTLNRGDVVYTFGATGDVMSVKLASNSSDGTSATTLGVVNETIIPNGIGYVTVAGRIDKLSFPAPFADGDTLWLGSTPGTFTRVKPVAPQHGVYLGVIERANNGNGIAYIKVQNGYELNELHDVLINGVSAGDVLQRNSSNTLWVNAPLSADKWNSVYTTVQNNSATSWNYQGTDLKSLSGNWQNTYTNYSSNSASYIKANTSDATPVYSIRALTQTQYDAISIKDPNTIYFITT